MSGSYDAVLSMIDRDRDYVVVLTQDVVRNSSVNPKSQK